MNKKIIISLFSLLVGLSVFVTSCAETNDGGTPAAPNFELTLVSDSFNNSTNFTFEGGIINNKEGTEIASKSFYLKVTDKKVASGATQTPVYAFLPTTPFTNVVADAEVTSVIVAGSAHVMAATATLTTASNIPYPAEDGLLYSNVQLTCNAYNAEAGISGISAANLKINCTNEGATRLDSTVFSDEAKQTAARNAVTQSSATYKIAKFPSAAVYDTVASEFVATINAQTKISDVVDYVNGLEQAYATVADISEVTVTATSTLSFTPGATAPAVVVTGATGTSDIGINDKWEMKASTDSTDVTSGIYIDNSGDAPVIRITESLVRAQVNDDNYEIPAKTDEKTEIVAYKFTIEGVFVAGVDNTINFFSPPTVTTDGYEVWVKKETPTDAYTPAAAEILVAIYNYKAENLTDTAVVDTLTVDFNSLRSDLEATITSYTGLTNGGNVNDGFTNPTDYTKGKSTFFGTPLTPTVELVKE